jgi:hypothetical protein
MLPEHINGFTYLGRDRHHLQMHRLSTTHPVVPIDRLFFTGHDRKLDYKKFWCGFWQRTDPFRSVLWHGGRSLALKINI